MEAVKAPRDTFLDALPDSLPSEARAAIAGWAELDAVLHRWCAEASVAWPRLDVAPEQFLAYVGARAGSIPELSVATLEQGLHTSDLYLACACAHGVKGALAAFTARHEPLIAGAVSRMRLSAASVEDLQQHVIAQLFVADPPRRPKILEFTGVGSLAGWLRVLSVRAAIKLHRNKTEILTEDARLVEASANDGSPELRYLKGMARELFHASFAEALAALPADMQTHLRQHYIDQLSIDELGALHGAHRTTTARWLRDARAALLAGIRKALLARTKGDASVCDSLIRDARSQFDLTFRSLFRPR